VVGGPLHLLLKLHTLHAAFLVVADGNTARFRMDNLGRNVEPGTLGWRPKGLVARTSPGAFCRSRDFPFTYLRMAAGGPLSAAQLVLKGMPAVHPTLHRPIYDMRLGL